jgi:hypothetical protein
MAGYAWCGAARNVFEYASTFWSMPTHAFE